MYQKTITLPDENDVVLTANNCTVKVITVIDGLECAASMETFTPETAIELIDLFEEPNAIAFRKQMILALNKPDFFKS
jgi:hypothetical protein